MKKTSRRSGIHGLHVVLGSPVEFGAEGQGELFWGCPVVGLINRRGDAGRGFKWPPRYVVRIWFTSDITILKKLNYYSKGNRLYINTIALLLL